MIARRTFLYLVAGLCFSLGANSHAATLRAMRLADLVQQADVIFVGTAIESVSAWNAEHTRIYTRTTFQVEESLKGNARGTIVIETLGGAVKGLGMKVPGMPVFRVKERNLIFVTTGRRTGTHRVLGWAQGNFQIRRDPQTGREIVTRSMAGVSLVGAPSTSREEVQDLDQLKDAIHSLLRR